MATDSPNTIERQVYYPSAVVHLHLRFDESLTIVPELPDPQSPLSLAEAPRMQSMGTKQTRLPLILEGQRDKLSHVLNILPRELSVELPGHRQAGKFNMTIDYRDFPIDPRLVRACGVEVYLGPVVADEFSSGMMTMPSKLSDGRSQHTRRSVLRTFTDEGAPVDDYLLMVGDVDVFNVEHTDKGSLVRMEGRDLRGLLLDSPIKPQVLTKLDTSQPIHKVVQQIISYHPLGERFAISIKESDWYAAGLKSIPSPADKNNLTRVRAGAKGGKKGGSAKPAGDAQQLTFWQIITQYCFLCGAIPTFVGRELRIRPARSIYDQFKKQGYDPQWPTPFIGGKPRASTTGEPPGRKEWNVRRMLYGNNVGKLSFERKLHGRKVAVIECVGYDTSSDVRGPGKLVTVRWPDVSFGKKGPKFKTKAAKQAAMSNVASSGKMTETDVVRFPVPGVKSVAQLKLVAQAIFEETARGEMGGACETHDLASFGGDSQDPDLIRLRPGDGVEFFVDTRTLRDRSPLVAELVSHDRRGFDEQVAAVTAVTGDPNLARVIVASSRGTVNEIQRFFYVNNVKFSFSADKGLSLAFDFQNYVEARIGELSKEALTGFKQPSNKNTAQPKLTVVP